MSENLKINTRVRRLFHYIDDFERGNIQVPAFQRDHIWNTKDKVELFESIKLGYPIGSILFWRPDFKSNKDFLKFEADKIGSYYLPERSQDFFYILDGYQRLSTLLGCLVNPEKTNLKRDDLEWHKEFNLIYNLETDKFEPNRKSNRLEIFKVPLYKFVDGKEFFEFQKQLLSLGLNQETIDDYIKKYENLSSKIIDYNIPSIDMIGGSIKEAVDIFSRVNSKGAQITDDWKVSALSFDKERDFRLGSEIDVLLKEIKIYNFNKISRELIFACIKNSFGKPFFDQGKKSSDLEELAARPEFVDITRNTLSSIKKSIKFLFEDCSVIDGKLLPYSIQLIFITDFFSKIDRPNQIQLTQLKEWFWVTSFTNFFTSNLSLQRLAYSKFQNFIHDYNTNPIYLDMNNQNWSVSKLLPKISMKSVRAKSTAILMLSRSINSFSLNLSTIKGFISYNLFEEIDDIRKFNSVENTILIVDCEELKQHLNILPSTKSLGYLLQTDFDLEPFYITREMKREFLNNGNIDQFLMQRSLEIQKNEASFVKQLDLDYLPF